MRIKHVPCPKCREQGKDRSGDNLAMYPDGGGFCFSCGFNLPTKNYTAPSQSFAGKRVEDAERKQNINARASHIDPKISNPRACPSRNTASERDHYSYSASCA